MTGQVKGDLLIQVTSNTGDHMGSGLTVYDYLS